MIKININAHSRYPVGRKGLRTVLKKWLIKQGLDNVELTIKIAGDRMTRNLNKKFRGQVETASILAFPWEDSRKINNFPPPANDMDNQGKRGDNQERLYLGDLLISYPQAVEQAVEMNVLVDERIIALAKHGLKKLLGV